MQTESPYQLPSVLGKHFRVVVRAFDRAGNVTDEQINITVGTSVLSWIKANIFILLGIALAALILYFILHLHLWNRVQRYKAVLKRMQAEEHEKEEIAHHHEVPPGS